MRKGTWSAAAAIVLLSGGGLVLWGPAVEAADTKVAMKDDLTFEPADITVPVGGSVVWHNDGSIQHDAKADDGSFNTPMIDPGKDSQPITFKAPGDIKYSCTVPGHKSAGMVGTVHVGTSTPTTVPATTTTQASGGATTTTAAGGQSTTTTAKSVNGASTTTTAAAGAAGATTTTLAASATPTSAPTSSGETTTTAAQGGAEAAEGGHDSGGGSHEDTKSSPIGIAFAAVSTLLLGGIAGKLLLSKP